MAQTAATSAPAYNSADLAFFDNVLDDLIGKLAIAGLTPSMDESRDALRRQIGAKLFECARAGERDHVALRQRVLSSMFPGKSDLPA